MNTDSQLSERGIPAKRFDWKYFLSEAGGKQHLEKAVRSGDFSGILHAHVYQRAIELSNPKPTDRILDVGCGRGELAFMLASLGFPVEGWDYSSASVKLCGELRKYLSGKQRQLVSFRQRDILLIDPLPEREAYDIVFFIDVIEHLTASEGKRALVNIYRLLKQGGKLIVHTNNLLFESVAYRAIAFFYHGLRAFTNFGTEGIKAVKSPYEHLHIRYYSKGMLAKALREADFEAKVWYTHPETLAQVQGLISPGRSWIRRPVPHLVWWLSKTPLISLMSPSLWAVGEKR